MTTPISLTFTQCKQLIEKGVDLRDFIQSIEDQPEFIKSMGAIDSISEMQGIIQGGCASGAYMPAVTYHVANSTMGEHGDNVLDYLDSQLGELPPIQGGESWSGMAVHYLSCAVEVWVGQFDLNDVDWD